ncbi:MAG: GntP family permease [Chitinophagaceae bacterium]|nr:GntP family permease [Chitinophagaceae bacterium]
MYNSLIVTIISLIAGVLVIILCTVRFKLHPFFALLLACVVTGLGVGLGVNEILQLIKTGFGDILSKLTLIIVLGTSIGVLLEKNGATTVMANFILKIVGAKRSALALSLTGFIVGLPIFCDSGYIVLNGINKSLIRRTGFTVAQMSISLAAGLYSVHCLIPPHPGATAAAASLSVDFGRLILYGIVIAIPAMFAGHLWAIWAGRITPSDSTDQTIDEETKNYPTVLMSFLPVLIPIVLMSLRSLVDQESKNLTTIDRTLFIIGDPAVALAVGVLLAIMISKGNFKTIIPELSGAVEKAGSILVIIAAGAAFGAILGATNIGLHISESVDLKLFGIWFPFLLTAIIKTAQGSSTVAIVTASSIVLPLLPALGLDAENGRLLAVLSLGAGSMMISHTNDAYFWVIAKFSGIDVRTMLKVHSVSSIVMGITTMLFVYLLSLLIL